MYSNAQKRWAKDYLAKCETKIFSVMDSIKKDHPYTTVDGKYDNFEIFPFSWTSGFFGGMMWLLYQHTGKKEYKNRAIQCSQRMKLALSEPENYNCLDNHDLGFVFSLTNVAHYRICGDLAAKIRGFHAATMLAGRFNLKGNYIRAWRNGIMGADTRGYAIIDCLMNLPLLYWAAEEYGDDRFALFAKAHANTVVKEFVRPDGSVHHIVDFDPETGEVRGYPRGQGYASGTSWSRGQSWGIYGFALSYRYTKDPVYLDAARGVADYVMSHMNPNELAKVDFYQPEEPDFRDASATACIASGMIELAKYCGDDGEKYAEYAFKLLETLYSNSDFTLEEQAIVQTCTEKYHGERHHIPLIYADFYLIEALMKCIGEQELALW